ncbi:hypothetical protein N7478_000351 [Penicillium angulare]|uniref:uncharacterized protein n=1 Tax=Penicillium angulare TaxID=116970 RepID=UPI00254104C9|nr:uncharacterized protein N7478_000351 [Penicillium angulare]KAJ5291100.1 hypothetical protein N7478_000351 [Penicillium angulare]
MGAGVILEPLVVVVLLFGGSWINRRTSAFTSQNHFRWTSDETMRSESPDSLQSKYASPTPKDGLLSPRAVSPVSSIGIFGLSFLVTSPNTIVFEDRLLSRLLRKLPFLVENWYWALVYWTYQLGRAFTAVTLQEGTVDVARRHALQLVKLEEKLGMFWELPIQRYFLRHPLAMTWINWIYSFIHIPGTIAFLVWLYYYTITRNRVDEHQLGKTAGTVSGSPAGPLLYQARRRTLAVCNLLAFVVFTLWPCMPPRLLSDPAAEGIEAELGRSYGFVDTVHGTKGAGSVWTENRFCNQYAAMPSLHFGYSLMIGLTIMTIPLPSLHQRAVRFRFSHGIGLWLPSWYHLVCLVLGFLYPFVILIAIVATANHFILDAVAGALVCALGWRFNGVLLNLLPLEGYFLCLVRIHKPEPSENNMRYSSRDWDSDNSDERNNALSA